MPKDIDFLDEDKSIFFKTANLPKSRLKIAIKCIEISKLPKFNHNTYYGDSNHFRKNCQKMIFFWTKINIYFSKRSICQNWAENCHKKHKKVQNDLKFAHNMHYGDSNHFQKIAKK